jgi:hypothetical protein
MNFLFLYTKILGPATKIQKCVLYADLLCNIFTKACNSPVISTTSTNIACEVAFKVNKSVWTAVTILSKNSHEWQEYATTDKL